jgi:hypothetical protein
MAAVSGQRTVTTARIYPGETMTTEKGGIK